jgi:D-3-phosphoglycerate dehydrogenase / 2-oxoglutarate reductase
VSPDKPRILVAESGGFSERAVALLRGLGDVVLADLDRGELVGAVGEAEVLWVRLRSRIDAEVMTAAKRLKVIVSPTTGLNHIDLEEAGRRGIRILSLRGETEFLRDVRATAEHTIAVMLALLRRMPAATTHVRDGGWDRDRFRGRELYGTTIGIVGYGRLGRIVARYLRAFDTRVLTADPHLDEGTVEAGVTIVSLSRLLHEADLVTLHVNMCDETRGFFGREQFAVMKPGAWFINTSRGELVDETALLEALESGRLGGAAVDVLGDEDPAGMLAHPLVGYARAHDNLLSTPHIGGCTVESTEKTELFLARKLGPVIAALENL